MILLEDVAFLEDVFEKYFQKTTWSNNYMLKGEYVKHIESKKLFFSQEGSNIYFLLQKNGFYRLYYFINEPEKYFITSEKLPIVLEILYRGEENFPQKHHEFWQQSGFESHLTRDCYFLKIKEIKEIKEFEFSEDLHIQNAASLDEIHYAKKLIDYELDLFTGDNLSLNEVSEFAKEECVYMAYSDGKLCGFLQSEFKNNTFWLGHIVVDSTFRGKGIAKALVNHYINQGKDRKCNQFQLWVIKDNHVAVELYKKYGFTYLNKSTYSMLKQ
jgi:ribosomal protein S18 acetylase RimI-like enzyme